MSFVDRMKTNGRLILIYGSMMAVELCWLYALLALVNRQIAGDQLFLLGLLLFLPLAFFFNKFVKLLGWHRRILTLLNWLAWAVIMLLAIKLTLFGNLPWKDPAWLLALPRSVPQLIYGLEPELILCMSSAVVWWLGKWMAYRDVSFENSVTEFQFGLIMLLLVFLVAYLLKLELAGSIPVTVAFFFFSLTGISIAHEGQGKSWLDESSRARWMAMLLLSIIIILLIGWIISFAISHDLLQILVDAVKWVGKLILIVLTFFASLFPESGSSGVLPPGPEIPAMDPDQGMISLAIPEPLRSWLQALMGFLWIGLIAVALWRVSTQIAKWLRGRWYSADAEVEHLQGGFRADLVLLFTSIWKGIFKLRLLIRGLWKREVRAPVFLSVQYVYKRLLGWGAKHGYSRQLWQTPDEYLQTLYKSFPQVHAEVSFITRTYVLARYGNIVPTQAEIDELKNSLQRLTRYRHKKK